MRLLTWLGIQKLAVLIMLAFLTSECTHSGEEKKSEEAVSEDEGATAEGEGAVKEETPESGGAVKDTKEAKKETKDKKSKKEKKSKKKKSKKKAEVNFNATDVKLAVTEYITEQMGYNDGVFVMADEQTEEDLELEFVELHDPVRVVPGAGYFACADFREVNGPASKLYDIDFWLDDNSEELEVIEVKIHKHPELDGNSWKKVARSTFEEDQPVTDVR